MKIARILTYLVLLTGAHVALGEEPIQPAKRYALAAGFYNRELYEFAAEEYQQFLEHHPQHEDAPRAKLFLAKSLARSGRDDDARKLLNGLSKSAQSYTAAESQLELGRLDFGASRFKTALSYFEQAAAEGAPEDTKAEALLGLAETKFQLKDYVGAEGLYRKIIEADKKGRRSAAASYGLAWSLYRKGDVARARTAFESFAKDFSTNPVAVEARLLRGDCLLQEKKWDEAYRAYAEASAADPRCLDRAQFGKGRACLLKGDLGGAVREFGTLVRTCPKSALRPQALLALAETYLKTKDYRNTVNTLKDVPAPDAADRPAEADFILGQAHLGLGSPKDAAGALERAVRRAPKGAPWHTDARLCYASALCAAADYKAAEAVYRTLAASHGSTAFAPRILLGLARTLHHQGRYKDSLTVLGKLEQKLQGTPVEPQHSFLQAENLFFLKDYREAGKAYSALRKASPQFEAFMARLRLAWCAYYDGRYADAQRDAEVLLRERCEDDVRESLAYLSARSLCALERYHHAAAFFEQAYAARKGKGLFSEESLFYRGKCLSTGSRAGDAEKVFADYEKTYPKGRYLSQVRLERSRICMQQKRFEEARKLYTALLSANPDPAAQPYILYGLAGSLHETGDAAGAATRYREARQKFPNHQLAPACLLGEAMALSAAAPEQAAPLYRQYLQLHGKGEAAFDAHLGLARACRTMKKHQDALAELAICAEKFPKHDGLWIVLGEKAETLAALSRPKEALAAYRTIWEKFRSSFYAPRAAYELGEADLDEEKLDSALKLFLEAEKLDGVMLLGAPLVYRIAWIYWRKNDAPRADKYFTELITRYPKDALAARARVLEAELLFSGGKYKESADALAKVAAEQGTPPLLDRALLRLGDSYAKLSKWQDSLKCYQDLIARTPKSSLRAESHYGVGTALQNMGRFKDALTAYEHATGCGSAPTAAKARFMAGQCYFHMGEFDRAAKETLKVPVLAPDNALVFPALLEAGKCFEKLERWKEAAQLYREILSKEDNKRWAETAQTRLAAIGTRSGN